ncbi:efflux RND transporter periplasmic adaptor subunit [Mesobacillus subterraneus]|uniref:efflux RND transporter periplasmic adaptor subunit n=1 Tax=Mesobacillus subterraneus TaxID=285983 RepID=UPI001CFEB6F8|nr:efflux RND transporter periplasmic adaptor subunit [Mesobacillus subterraneus]WLR54457.1 efflux RND transporter periplasmic adaptor subunit [Mesobacillus subterraneus]
MNKKIWIAIGVAGLVLLMAGVSIYRQAFAKGPEVKVQNPSKEEIADEIMIPGTVVLEEEQKVYASPEKGKLAEILVKEGETVKKGDVLAKYDHSALKLELERVKLQAESGYLRINQLDKKIKDVREKESELSKQIGKKAAKEQTEAEIDQFEAEKRLANIDLRQVLLQQKDTEARLQDLEIKSSIDGVVLQVNEESPADPAAAVKPVIHIGDLDAKGASGLLSEFDSMKVKEGQKVKLHSDVLPEKEWNGVVEEIAVFPEETQSQAMGGPSAVQYPIKVKATDMELKPGFQLIMEIETERKHALTVPAAAVLTDKDYVYVFLLKEGKSHKQEIETGIAFGSKMEVISGLSEKDRVIVNPSDDLKDGMEVDVK